MNQSLLSIRCIRCLHLMIRKCASVPVIKASDLKPATLSYKSNRIVDKVHIYVRGGSGGQGCPSTGGIGGEGGHVFIKCIKGASLRSYTLRNNRRIIAEHGQSYEQGKMKMKPGKNVFVTVPPGTEIEMI